MGITEGFSFRPFPWLDNSNQVSVYHTDARSSILFVENINGYGMYLSTHNTVYLNSAKTFAAFMNFWYQFPEVDHIGRADACSKLDFGFTAKALKDKMDISLNLNDAFQSSASAVSSTVNGIRTKFSNFQINRYVQLSISYRFGQESGAGKRDTGNEEERGRVQ